MPIPLPCVATEIRGCFPSNLWPRFCLAGLPETQKVLNAKNSLIFRSPVTIVMTTNSPAKKPTVLDSFCSLLVMILTRTGIAKAIFLIEKL